MEFYNVKLLPKGLPEIISQFVPYKCYENTKVIVYPKGATNKKGARPMGQFGYDQQTENWTISLWPTRIAFHSRGPGTYSFILWQELLKVALHEVGHQSTYPQYCHINYAYDDDWKVWCYIEQLADNWQERAFAKILSRDPRLGQPPGRLTGYPGILAYNRRAGNFEYLDYARIIEWRALRCDAQLTINDIANRLSDDLQASYQGYQYAKKWLARLVRRVALGLGVTRVYVSRTGSRYLMFNVGEAETVLQACRSQVDTAIKQLNLGQLYRIYGRLTDDPYEYKGFGGFGAGAQLNLFDLTSEGDVLGYTEIATLRNREWGVLI